MSVCVECGEDRTRVIETRMDVDRGWRMRRRLCEACSARFWTYEIPQSQLEVHDAEEAQESNE